MTDVYVYDHGAEPLEESAMLLLSPWRRERTERLKNAGARQESLAAGLLLGYAAERQGISPWEPVKILPAGRPVFAERQDVWFSLSHSGRYALCAVSDAPVGADVQQMRPANPSMARRLHPDEREWLSRQPAEEQQSAFFRLWTRKEAWVKAVSGERMLSLSETDIIHRLPGLWFWDRTLPEGYQTAVCTREEREPLFHTVTNEELLKGTHIQTKKEKQA